MNRHRNNRRRRGAAVVELAVCLPVMFVLVLGAIECCSMIFVEQSLNVVAYEGVRAATKNNADPGDGMARALQVVGERKLRDATVTFSPSNPERAGRGAPVSLTVTVPCEPNSVLGLDFFSGSLEAVVVMNKE